MAKLEISDIKFMGLTTIVPGSSDVEHWSPTRPAHDPNRGKQTCREVRDERGVTLAVFIAYEAGPVMLEVEIGAANIRNITRRPVADPPAPEKPVAKAGAK